MLSLILILVNSAHSYGQDKDSLLDVHKIVVAHYAEKQEGISYSQKELDAYGEYKKGQVLFTAYAHPDYLHATMQSINNTTWIIQYRNNKALQIAGGTALPMEYKNLFKDFFYYSDEQIADSSNGYGIVTLTEDTLTVAGYGCKRAIVHFIPGPLKRAEGTITGEVWYSPELPAFYLPSFDYLRKIPGAALYISVDMGQNMKLGYRATGVEKERKPLSFFDLPEGMNVLYPPKAPEK